MSIYLGKNKIGPVIPVQKPDMLQARVDSNNSCEHLFYNFKGTDLSFIKNLDTSNVTNMKYMFAECSSLTILDLSKFDTSNVTNMYGMFEYCSRLTTLDLSNFNTSKVTSMYYMFYECQSLTSINLLNFNFSNVTTMYDMFRNCKKLQTIIGDINLYSEPSIGSLFLNCSALEDVTLLNIKKNLTLGSGTTYGTKLTNESLINTIQQLWDLTGSESKKLTLSTTSKENIANIYVKLVDVTDEMLAQDQYAANKKPCVVCESTDEGAMTLTEYATSKNWAIA